MLPETLASFLDKLEHTYEAIIVDDGSTDGTPDYLKTLGEPCRILLHDHRGGQSARNAGMRSAQGRYLKFVDDDDFLEPGVVDEQIAFLDRSPDLDVCYCDWGELYQCPGQPDRRRIGTDGARLSLIDQLVGHYGIPTIDYLYRRQTIVGLSWNESIPVIQDVHFIVDVVASGARVGYLPTSPHVVGWYRMLAGEKRVSDANILTRIRCIQQVYDKLVALLMHNDTLTQERQQSLAARYFFLAEQVFRHDRPLFRQLLNQATQLCPEFEPPGPRFRQSVKLFGFERAEVLRQISIAVRRRLR